MILPSGAELKVTVADFAVSKALYQAILEEAKAVHIDPVAEIDVNLFKDMFCACMSSKKVEVCLAECLKRVTYNGLKIDKDTFEPVEAREDFTTVCFEVAKENVAPFMKSLFAQFAPILGELKNGPALRQKTTTS